MTDQRATGGTIIARKDEAQQKGEQYVADLFANALRAGAERDAAVQGRDRANALLSIADERVKGLVGELGKIMRERDFFMRHGASMAGRVDQVLDTVVTVRDQFKDVAAAIDAAIATLRPKADRAHEAYLLCSTLTTTIENLRLEARDAAFRPPELAPPVPQVTDHPDESAEALGRKLGADAAALDGTDRH